MSIGCEGMREHMSALLDGQLEAAETGPLQAHLDSCLLCRAALDAMHGVDRLLSAAPTISPACGFVGRFHFRLAARRNRRRTLIGLTLLTLTTTFLMLVGAGLLTASNLYAWQESDVSLPGLYQGVTGSLVRVGQAAERVLDLARVVWRAMERVRSHQMFVSVVVATALLAAVWAWAVGLRPHALRPVRAA
jgi:predicted anti-sigma-YlaC factor YlaD